jgi:hypothetical protein
MLRPFQSCNQAVQAFLGEMSLTQDELLARPQLVDAIRKSAARPCQSTLDFAPLYFI